MVYGGALDAFRLMFAWKLRSCVRRQFQRAFAGFFAPPGPGGGGGAPMIITRSPPLIMIGPPPDDDTLKLTVAPTLSVCWRDRASSTTSTTLANRGSGRRPVSSDGAFRLRPRI